MSERVLKIEEDYDLGELQLNSQGLIPAVVQDVVTKQVLMLAYMNRESIAKTLETGYTWFWSRSRSRLWQKGEVSGNVQKVQQIDYDCDSDTLLVKVNQKGAACHTGERSCFYRTLALRDKAAKEEIETEEEVGTEEEIGTEEVLDMLVLVIQERERLRPKGSYVSYLFDKGLDKMLKKLGEEAAEVIIAAKNNSEDELIHEAADLLFHLMVLLVASGLDHNNILQELKERHKKE